MPIGKVKWYDAEKGFGFVSNSGDEDVYVGRNVLPKGVEELFPGQRIDFDEGSVQLVGNLDPLLHFVAQTQSNDVTAIVTVDGRASAPKMSA